jgi:MFS family permease
VTVATPPPTHAPSPPTDRRGLGPEFVKLWLATAVSTTGDGITVVAGPLLIASLTSDPVLVAGGAVAQQLPWLVLALLSGAVADRVDRRRLVVAVHLCRTVALGVLVTAVATGHATVWLCYVVFFLLGAGETLAETASSAFVPAIVPTERLAGANARLLGTFTVANQFVAKPLGGWLFAVAAAAPFGADALSFVVAAALVFAMRPLPAGGPVVGLAAGPAEKAKSRLVDEIIAGVRWLWGQRLLRTLAVAMGLGNVAFCSAFAVFVLYARHRLGLSPLGYGVLLTTLAVGGVGGTLLAPRLLARLRHGVLLRAGLLVEAVTHLTLALTSLPVVAGGILVLFGVQTTCWGTITMTLRQRAVPAALWSRVSSVYLLLETGGAAVGSVLGGLLAGAFGLTAPFWIAGAEMVLIALASWRALAGPAA